MIYRSTLPSPARTADLAPLVATVSLQALAHNVAELRRHLSPACDLMAVVKANAYGHGAPTIAQTLAANGIRRFGVATVHEGVALRGHGLTHPILVMGGMITPHLPELLQHGLTPVISNTHIAAQLAEQLDPHMMPLPVHVKVDTGMRRLGFATSDVRAFLKSSLFHDHFCLEGLMTHLADADHPDASWTNAQLTEFQRVIGECRADGHTPTVIHAANSAGILRHPHSHFDLVRPGISLYGYTTTSDVIRNLALQPIMRITTYVSHLQRADPGDRIGYNGSVTAARAMRLAVLPVGYAHGYSRALSNKGHVLIRGTRAPIVGKICMDMMMADITDVPDVDVEDEVVVLGEQGHASIDAHDLARWLNTVPYEVLCQLGARAHHVYHPPQAPAIA